jgi:hypothetical protein
MPLLSCSRAIRHLGFYPVSPVILGTETVPVSSHRPARRVVRLPLKHCFRRGVMLDVYGSITTPTNMQVKTIR